MEPLLARVGHLGGHIRAPRMQSHLVGGGWFFGGFITLVVLGLLIALIVVMILNLRRGRGPIATMTPAVPKGDPLEIARMRYARGEVTRDEFLETMKELTRDPSKGGGDPDA